MKENLTYLEKIKKIKETIASADAIVIGAGAGLSTSAGFTHTVRLKSTGRIGAATYM